MPAISRQLNLDATQDSWPRAEAFLDDALQACPGLPPKTARQFTLAAEEAYVNVVNYAYAETAPGSVALSFDCDQAARALHLAIEDHGIPYNPLDRPDPDLHLDADQRPIGGLGIFLVRQLMDRVEYSRRDDTNRLEFWKNF
jgi:anti-sigma regulatory factor (Ser/Thr protein kinase)